MSSESRSARGSSGAALVTQADQNRWQHQAARELAAILHDSASLPPISWTVSSAECGLTGQISGLAPASEVRASFDTWRRALRLDDMYEATNSSGTVTFLHASARRGGVRVTVTAHVFTADDAEERAPRAQVTREEHAHERRSQPGRWIDRPPPRPLVPDHAPQGPRP